MNSAHKKRQLLAFLSPAFRMKNTVGSINSEVCFFLYQTGCIYILSKTHTQFLKQTLSYKYLPFHAFHCIPEINLLFSLANRRWSGDSWQKGGADSAVSTEQFL